MNSMAQKRAWANPHITANAQGGTAMGTINTDTLARGRVLAQNLRQEGRVDDAQTVDALLQAVESNETVSPYLTTSQVGRRLGVSRQTVVNWIKKGLLPGIRLGGRMMVPQTTLERFARLEKLLDELDAEREPGQTEEIVELVGRGRKNWTWSNQED